MVLVRYSTSPSLDNSPFVPVPYSLKTPFTSRSMPLLPPPASMSCSRPIAVNAAVSSSWLKSPSPFSSKCVMTSEASVWISALVNGTVGGFGGGDGTRSSICLIASEACCAQSLYDAHPSDSSANLVWVQSRNRWTLWPSGNIFGTCK